MKPTTPTEAILLAAEEVILSEGIGSLSLDAIAKRVGLSKSGLLHHFPSKDALIHGLVLLKCSQWKADCDEAFDEQPPGPYPTARAFLEMCFVGRDSFCEECLRSSMVLVAALVHDARHVAPIRDVRRYLASRLEADGLPEGTYELLLLTIDGLWFGRLFGVAEPTPVALKAIRGHIEGLIRSTVGDGSGGGSGGGSGAARGRDGRTGRGKSAARTVSRNTALEKKKTVLEKKEPARVTPRRKKL